MLCGRSQHFRTQEAAGGELSVSVQQAFVPEQDTRTALVLEAYLAGGEGTRFHRMESAPDNADLRIGKHDGHGRAAQARIYPLAEREARGILTCNASLVGRLVKQRDEVAGIAGDENRACPIVARAPGGRRIVRWHAFGVEFERGLVEANARHIGRAAGGSQDEIEVLGHFRTTWPSASKGDAVALTLHEDNVRVRFQREFLVEGRDGVSTDFRVADAGDAAAPAEHRNTNTQTMQCLAEFQADY